MKLALKSQGKTLVLISLAMGACLPCMAEETELKQGMYSYRHRDYSEALSHLDAALPLEFNNANLHYHMANCMVHMRQKESAIREYRIAYALDPHGKAGNYSKMCLHLFGIDAAGFLPLPEAPPKLEKGKAKDEGKGNGAEIVAKKDSGLANVAKYVSEEEKVRQNLLDLMQQTKRPGGAKLQEVGTNEFVRNYKEPPRISQALTARNSGGKTVIPKPQEPVKAGQANDLKKQTANVKSGATAPNKTSSSSPKAAH
jgi:tetratricopeptide (TPR) repeat protein